MKLEKVKLKIADIVITLQSKFPQKGFSPQETKPMFTERFKNFIYDGNERADIVIDIDIVNKLPQPKDIRDIFMVYHPDDGNKNWQLSKKGDTYIFKNFFSKEKEQVMFINRDFNRIKAYLLPKKDKGFVWDFTDIIYDFLQILLINYFAQRNSGIFLHAVGIKDSYGKGYVFTGKSGAGKTTTAKTWHRHSNATVLNDDRVIVRKIKKNFFVYGSPWHGAFSDYLISRTDEARLDKLFFIYHSPKNTAKPVAAEKAFRLLYPTTFPTFWDKQGLEKTISFCEDLVKNISCFHLGLAKDKKAINFVRNIR